MIESYRRFRAVNRYEYSLAFWMLDSVFLTNPRHYTAKISQAIDSMRSAGAADTANAEGAAVEPTSAITLPVRLDPVEAQKLSPASVTVAKVPTVIGKQTSKPEVQAIQSSERKAPKKSPLASSSQQPLLISRVTVTVGQANLRSSAEKGSNVLDIVSQGERLDFHYYEGDWAKVGTAEHKIAFIHRSVISVPQFSDTDAAL